MTNPDLEGIRAFEVSGSGFDEYFPAYTSLNAAETEISFIVRNSITGDVVNAVGAVVNYHKQPTDVTRGDFEATRHKLMLTLKQILTYLKSIFKCVLSIVAKTRKLKAVWTPELAQDLNAYHQLTLKLNLPSLLSEYVSMEIDLEILDMLGS